jgi:hypothetical protein
MPTKPARRPNTTGDDLRRIPGIGPSLAADLRRLGFRQVSDLRAADPEAMYQRLCRLTGERQDPCVLYAFRCAVYFASRSRHQPELLKWWNWKSRTVARPPARQR